MGEPVLQPKTQKTNLMSLKPADVEARLKAGQITNDDAMTYVHRKRLAKQKLHDYEPAEVEEAYRLGVVKQEQVDDYIDRRSNPVSYHVKDFFGSALQGATSAVDETVQTAEWFAKNASIEGIVLKAVMKTKAKTPQAKKDVDTAFNTVKKPLIGEVHKPKTAVGEVTKGVAQFITGFIPANKAAQGINVAKEGVKLVGKELAKSNAKKTFIQGTVAGAMTDFTVFDEHDERLSNLIQSSPTLANPITDYLKAENNDSVLEGKLKNAIEGSVVGTAAEALFMGIKQVKNLKLAKHDEDLGDVAAEISAKFDDVGKPKKKGKKSKGKAEEVPPVAETPMVEPVVKPIDEAMANPQATPLHTVDNIAEEATQVKPDVPNGSELYDDSTHLKLSTTLDQGQAQELANAILARHGATDTLDDPGVFNQKHMDMLNDTNMVRDAIILTSKTLDTEVVSHVKTKEIADEVGVDEATLIRTAQKLAGDTENAHAILVATKNLMLRYGNALAEQSDALMKRMDSATNPITMAERLQFVDNLKMFQSIQGTLKGITTNTARAVSAGRINVNGKAFDIEDMTSEDIAQLIGRGQKDGYAEIDDIIKLFNQQKDPAARARFAGKTHGKGLSGLVEYYQAALLSAPTTHVTNTVSSAANIFVDEFAGAITRSPTATKWRMKGLYRGIFDGFNLAKKAWVEEAPQLDKVHKMSNENGEVFGNFSIKGKKGEIVRALSFRPMLFIDEFFKNVTYRAELTSIAYENATKMQGLTKASDIEAYVNRVVSSPNKATHMKALEHARRMTFQEEFQPRGVDFGDTLKGTEEARMNVATGIDFVLQKGQQGLNNPYMGAPLKILVMPFYQTPVNLLKAAGRMTPGLNLLSKRYMEDIKAGGQTAARARAKVAIGSSIWFIGHYLYSTGNMVGSIDKDMQKIAADNGIAPYSVFSEEDGKLTSSSLMKMDPFITLLGIGADMAKAMEVYHLDEDEDFADLVGAFAASAGNMTLNRSFMKSMKEFIDAFNGENDETFIRFMQNKAASFIPYSGAWGNVQEATDDYQRQTMDIYEALWSKVHSENATKRYNALGEPKERVGRNFVAGAGQEYEVSQDPVLREMLDVRLNVTQPNKAVTIKGVEMELNGPQYERYNELIANPGGRKSLKEALQEQIDSPMYQNEEDAKDKADRLQRVINKYRIRARRMVVKEIEELSDQAGSREAILKSRDKASQKQTKVNEMTNHWTGSLNGE